MPTKKVPFPLGLEAMLPGPELAYVLAYWCKRLDELSLAQSRAMVVAAYRQKNYSAVAPLECIHAIATRFGEEAAIEAVTRAPC